MATSRAVSPGMRAGSRPRQAIGAIIPAVFGLVFVEADSGRLPGAWQPVVRVAAAVVFVALIAGIGRVRRALAAAPRAVGGPSMFSRGYWLIVAAEVVALLAGIVVINAVFGAHELTVAWIALIVGVHFFGLGGLWKAGALHVLGAVLAVLGVAGFVLHAAGGSNLVVALVSGVASGVALDVMAARWLYSALAGREAVETGGR